MKSPGQSSPPLDEPRSPSIAKRLKPLAPSFYQGDTLKIAKALLGKGLYVRDADGEVLVEIVETEAYLGTKDPASHSYRGLSKRNWPMFEKGGTCYVYLSYGLNFCMNVATNEKGRAEAVLFRAARPLGGLAVIESRRPLAKKETQLLSGPGRLCQGLGIDLNHNGWTFDRPDFKIVDLGPRVSPRDIGTSTRIGITKASSNPWRYFIKSSPWLSRKG